MRVVSNVRRVAFVALLISQVLLSTTMQKEVFGPWHRLSDRPVLSPQGNGWESAGTFNPSVVLRNGKYVMLYRAQDAAGTSPLGYGAGFDGGHFVRRLQPAVL